MACVGNPEKILSDLRWTADRIITNPFGDRVWLKQIHEGLTDCCSADEPCDYHARLASQPVTAGQGPLDHP